MTTSPKHPKLAGALCALALVAVPGAADAKHGDRDDDRRSERSARSDAKAPSAKVTSFADGVLLITLNDGSTVRGLVDSRTKIHCRTATTPAAGTTPASGTPTASAARRGDDDGSDGERSGRRGGEDRPSSSSDDDGDVRGDGSAEDAADDSDESDEDAGERRRGRDRGKRGRGRGGRRCTTAALTAGASVLDADVKVTQRGSVFRKVDLG